MKRSLTDYIGDRAYYKRVLAVLIPIIVQSAVTNFVSLLDNLMVGQVGTWEMSGVAIANQLIFIFFLAIFGAVSGAGIFTAQFCGAGNQDGVRHTMRYKLVATLILTLAFVIVYFFFGDSLVSRYLNEGGDPLREAETLRHAHAYLNIILISFLPYAVTQCYAGTLRENGETVVPMAASLAAVGVNLLFNYLLIFGKFGFPCMGVEGAAVATVIARFAELFIIVIYTHGHASRHVFAKGLFRTLRIPAKLAGKITVKTLPLVTNEFMWAAGMAALNRTFSLRGLDVVAAVNITTTVYDLFKVACFSMGSASGIIVGQRLGADDTEGAKKDCRRSVTLSVLIGIVFGAIMFALAAFIPTLYNTTDAIRELSAKLIRACGSVMLLHGVANCEYFILRSGGRTFITILFDSVFVWGISVTVANVLTRWTAWDIVMIYAVVQSLDIVKCVIGYAMLRKGIWINNIVTSLGEGERVGGE